MQDKVELVIAGVAVRGFQEYSLDADLYAGADVFSLKLSSPEVAIKGGLRCEVFVNGDLELTGILDKPSRRTDKGGRTMNAGGRDLMGILVDSCVEQYIDLSGFSLKGLAEKFLKTVPFINRKSIEYEKGSAPVATEEGENPRSNPGDTVFEVLRRAALSRGLLFYSRPNGTLVFGKPLAKGRPTFSLTLRRDGKGNNVISAEVTEDFSKRFSKVVVTGQTQEDVDDTAVNVLGTATDSTFPFYKPLVVELNQTGISASRQAKLTLDAQRAAGLTAVYTVAGHSQDGKNWGINQLVRVEDEDHDLKGDFLIYGRTFKRSKQAGATTELRLGVPGILA